MWPILTMAFPICKPLSYLLPGVCTSSLYSWHFIFTQIKCNFSIQKTLQVTYLLRIHTRSSLAGILLWVTWFFVSMVTQYLPIQRTLILAESTLWILDCSQIARRADSCKTWMNFNILIVVSWCFFSSTICWIIVF